jgi:D-arabinose 1-dehydrogenase-like Zn-dependent alcohol dehydrogenase
MGILAQNNERSVVEQFGKPLSLVELNIPSPGAGEILVKTEACGVCHTDLHAAHGDWPVKPTLPFIPGHEAIGLVAAGWFRGENCEGWRPRSECRGSTREPSADRYWLS